MTTTDLHVIALQHGGWGGRVAVSVAPTAAADAAARVFLGRLAGEIPDPPADLTPWPQLDALYFPICEHGMDGHLCMGPSHYCSDEEIARGW